MRVPNEGAERFLGCGVELVVHELGALYPSCMLNKS